MTKNQIVALADAHANAARGGLTRAGQKFYSTDRSGVSFGHHRRTIMSLVDRSLIRLWAGGTVAHITEGGERALEDYREEAARRRARLRPAERIEREANNG